MLAILLLLIICPCFVISKADHPYCFRMTWLGAHQDKENIGKMSCYDIHQDLTNVPCQHPLVATENDTYPDTRALWEKHKLQPHLYGCPMTPGITCAKFTYIYNKGVQNITYMCAKVNITEGCYLQRHISGLHVSVCTCKSKVGQMPCNSGRRLQGVVAILSILIGFNFML